MVWGLKKKLSKLFFYKPIERYEELREEMEGFMRPVLVLRVEMPQGLRSKGKFLKLGNDPEFLRRVQKLALRYLRRLQA